MNRYIVFETRSNGIETVFLVSRFPLNKRDLTFSLSTIIKSRPTVAVRLTNIFLFAQDCMRIYKKPSARNMDDIQRLYRYLSKVENQT